MSYIWKNVKQNNERHLIVLLVLKSFRKPVGRVFLVFFFFAIIFILVAISQSWFIHRQLYQITTQELTSSANQLIAEIAYKDKWDLVGYRQAEITASRWFVVTKNGLIIDVEGFIPGLFWSVESLNEQVFSSPQTVTSEVGETWRILGREILGGVVVVGIYSPKNVADADVKLLENVARFGSTIDQATSVKPREIDYDVDYAIVSSNGEFKEACGGIPLKVNLHSLPISYNRLVSLISNGKPYLLYSQPILDSNGQDVGTIILPKEIGLAQEALRTQINFNLRVFGVAALIVIVIAFWLAVPIFFDKTKKVSLAEALRVGEGGTVEFKSSFYWNLKGQFYDEEMKLAVLKSVAGFLNAKGGTLFIGVTEDEASHNPTLCGLDRDIEYYKGSKDELQQTLHNYIITRIGSQFSCFIADSLEESDGKLYWMIVVQASPEPAFVRWKAKGEKQEQKKFYVREGPRTGDLDNESTWRYIKNHWG